MCRNYLESLIVFQICRLHPQRFWSMKSEVVCQVTLVNPFTILLSPCQELWRVRCFILLAGQQISLPQFHGYWQNYMIPGSETAELSTHSTESNMIVSRFAIVLLASSPTSWFRHAQMDVCTCNGLCYWRGTLNLGYFYLYRNDIFVKIYLTKVSMTPVNYFNQNL